MPDDQLTQRGLRLNPKKHQAYFSPYLETSRKVMVNGVLLDRSDCLLVTGLHFHVEIYSSDLLGQLLARARDQAWSLRQSFRAKTPLGGRVRLLDRILRGTAL